MNSSLRFGTALGAIALLSTLSACSMRQPQAASNFGGKVDTQNIGLATKAQMALAANKLPEAVALAERAVAASPNDAGFRALLGNIYFAAGRFGSAETAYRDALTLLSNQPQVVLKLALVSVAQGKNAQAINFLEAARSVLDPSDYGLALALAGQPQQAAAVLQEAAQQVGADSRVRQNLALALALSGDWTGARSIAAQDVPGDQLDSRIQQWMAMAKPVRASDQVAALTGIAPAAADPGQPLRLALKDSGTRLAALAPVTEQAVTEVAVTEVAVAAPAPLADVPAPVMAAVTPDALAPAPVDMPALIAVASLAPKARSATPRPGLSPRAAALTDARTLYRRAALNRAAPQSRAVVQLGAYTTRSSIAAAWKKNANRFGALRGYTPLAARFDGERGTVYRLSVQGFASARQAIQMCSSLKRAGASCFVRNAAGDAPVRYASL